MKLSEEIAIQIQVCETQIERTTKEIKTAQSDFLQGMAGGTKVSYQVMLDELKKIYSKAVRMEQQYEEYKTDSEAYRAYRKAL